MNSIEMQAAARNARLQRDDIEWAVGSHGLYLRDKPAFTRWNTEAIERRHESDRHHHLSNNQGEG